MARRPIPAAAAASQQERAYAAALLRRLAVRADHEVDGGTVPIRGGEVALVDRGEVESWLYGCATRLEAGGDL